MRKPLSLLRPFFCKGLVLPILVALLAFSCLKAQTNVSGNQSGTWLKANSPYILTGVTTVPTGQTLTIQPGCKVLIPFNSYFNVNGTLVANGITTDSIVFYGTKNGSYTHGGQFNFAAGSVNSSIQYAVFDSLGYQANYNALINISTNSFSLSNSSIRNSAGNPFYLTVDTIRPAIADCNFSGSADVSRTLYCYPGTIANMTNISNAILDLNGSLTQSATWKKQGIGTIYKATGITVNAGKTLTIEAGNKIWLPYYYSTLTVNGTLIANGTPTDSIRFYGTKNGSYTHGGQFNFAAGSVNSSIQYAVFDSLGYQANYNALINISTNSFSLSNSSIRNSAGNPFYLTVDTIRPAIADCNFSGSADVSRTLYCYPGTIANMTNITNVILDLNGSLTQNATWKKQGIGTIYKASGITVNAGKTLTIEAGNKIWLPYYYSSLNVNGTLIANGTSADSIKFYGTKNGSYTHGGQFNFAAGSVNSSIQYAVFDSLGYQYNYNSLMNISTNSFSLSNSSIRNSFSYPFYLTVDTIRPVILDCNFSGADNSRTIYCYPGTVANMTNISNAILDLNGNLTQSATWKKQGIGTIYKATGITVNAGKTLTIEAGNRIWLPYYYSTLTVNGTLIANGTSTDSIRFYGTKNSYYTHGGQFNFAAGSVNSSIQYAVFDSLGYQANYNALINISTNNFFIGNSSIRNSAGNPFYLTVDTIRPAIADCNFSGSADVSRTLYCYPGTIANMTNISNAILDLNGSLTQSATWKKQGIGTIYKATGITVNAGKTLTIEAGNRIWLPYYYSTLIVNGTLIADGTPTDSIRFYGTKNSSYTHGGCLNFGAGSIGSSLQYAVFDSLGYPQSFTAAVVATGSLSIGNSSIRNSYYSGIQVNRSSVLISNCIIGSQSASYYGVYVPSDTTSPTVQNCTFYGNDLGRSIYAPSKSFSLITNNTNAILRTTGTINANTIWPKQNTNSYYQLDGAVTINAGSVLTVEPGNLINFPYTSSYLSVNGTLRAQGTETAQIRFLKIAGTGSGTYGGGVFLNSGSSNHVLSSCTFDKLGGYNGYALGVSTADASLSNLSISNSNSYGIYISGASPTITSSNITGSPYGVYSVSGKPVFNNCNIFANASYGIYNASGMVADTVDARNCYWGDASGPKHTMLNPFGLGNPVNDKVKFNPWKMQPANGQIVDMGVNAIIKPVTACNLTSADTVRVKLTNYGNIALANFPVAYRINNGPPVTETVAASLLPGSSQEYTFTQKANLGTPGMYSIKVYTAAASDSVPGNDTTAVTIQHLAGVNAPANLLPANNATNINLPVTLNWGAVPDVESYDLYIWKTAESVPATPTVAGLTQISYTFSTNLLQYGTGYNWKVVAKRSNCRAESAVQTFTTRQLPDLVVDSVFAPATAVSETDITLNFKVKNMGAGSTINTQWYDVVYISDQPVLGVGNDVYIGQLANFSALNTGESYTSANISYHIPQGTQGSFYIIVKTNYTGAVAELSDTNNRKVKPINIALAPPPDLQVTNLVVSPSTAFSEDSATISFTVQNLGTGPTTVSNWFDQVYLTKDTTLNVNTATSLFTVSRSQPLVVNGTYTITQKVKLPAQISGTYYVHVFTDRNNNVFEYTKENNDTRRSLPVNIILRPAPNLVISNFSVPADTVASGQSLNVQWTTRNDGAATAKPSWYEAVYYSTTATFNTATAVLVSGMYRYDSIASLGSSPAQQTIVVPNIPEGVYYFFVKTDVYNQVFESTGENDNISAASGPVRVVNPDLKPVQITAPASATSEQTFAVSWTVKNDSRAGIYNSSWSDYVYLSQDTILGGGDVYLGTQSISQFAPAGSEYTRQINVILPQAISGNYYLLVSTGNGLYEKTKANNLAYKAIPITLAPWPDLQVSNIVIPATDTIGSSLAFQYTVQNNGSGSIFNKSWTDYVYITSTNNVNTGSLTLLGSFSQNRTLNSGSSYTQAGNFTIPTSLNAGTYYIIVVTDISNQVYENTGESNNKTISAGIAMASVPPIDLSVTAGQLLSSSVTAGQPASLQWTVKNNSSNATVISSWHDAVYLSNNPVLDASDILLSTFTTSGPLAAGASYTQTHTVTIPNGISGTLYLLVQTDKDNVHTDPNRGNNTLSISNGGGQTIVITAPPPADLIIPAITAPAEATAAQPITVGFTVKNTGTGTTPANSWTDNVYLSTDNVLDYSDVQIGSLSHSGALTPGSHYSGTLDMTIPANLSGNYILIVKADGSNQVYEPNKSNNLSFSPIYIVSQPPSDLIVSEVTLPVSSQAAGTPITVNWKLKNIGNNTASGYIKEAVYLSADTLPDATDVLLGTLDGYINIPTLGVLNRELTKPLYGVAAGRYYLLVRTDILNNIIELNDNNNVKVSTDTLTVTVKQLPLYVLKTDTLPNSIPIYYRIEVPDSLAGETMSVKLTGDSVRNAVNRLFISYGKIPKSNEYDYAAAIPFRANQEAIIPELKAGTYYLTAYGSDTATALQPVSLFAKVIPFSISYVNAKQGGNGGAVTIQINGAKFEQGMTVQLLGANTLTAQAIYYTNSTRLYATFNLSGATLGSYTVKLTKEGGATGSTAKRVYRSAGIAGGQWPCRWWGI